MSRYIRIQQKTIIKSEPLISNDINIIKRACQELAIDFDSLEIKAFKKVLYVITKIIVDVYEDSCNKKVKTKEYLDKVNQIKELNQRISQIANIPCQSIALENKSLQLPLSIEDKKKHFIAIAKTKGYKIEENSENGKVKIKLVKS
jgi:hypothetical protein